MASYYKHTTQAPLLFHIKRNNLTQSNVCTLLNITQKTLRTWIDSPGIMQLKDMIMIAGLLKMDIVELVYLITRNKPLIKSQSGNTHEWYIEDIRERNK